MRVLYFEYGCRFVSKFFAVCTTSKCPTYRVNHRRDNSSFFTMHTQFVRLINKSTASISKYPPHLPFSPKIFWTPNKGNKWWNIILSSYIEWSILKRILAFHMHAVWNFRKRPNIWGGGRGCTLRDTSDSALLAICRRILQPDCYITQTQRKWTKGRGAGAPTKMKTSRNERMPMKKGL